MFMKADYFNVLMFHKISQAPSFHSAIRPAIFESCLQYIFNSKLEVKTIRDINETIRSSGPIIILTFDDGWHSDFTVALPALLKFKFPASFFIISGKADKSGYLYWDEIKKMANYGMEIGSHTHTHRHLSKLPAKTVKEELQRSKYDIEDRIGLEVSSISLPHGDYNRIVLKICREVGYKNICLSKPGLNQIPLSEKKNIHRNAFHRALSENSIPSMVSPRPHKILMKNIGYKGRFILRFSLGLKGYIKLRDKLFPQP